MHKRPLHCSVTSRPDIPRYGRQTLADGRMADRHLADCRMADRHLAARTIDWTDTWSLGQIEFKFVHLFNVFTANVCSMYNNCLFEQMSVTIFACWSRITRCRMLSVCQSRVTHCRMLSVCRSRITRCRMLSVCQSRITRCRICFSSARAASLVAGCFPSARAASLIAGYD